MGLDFKLGRIDETEHPYNLDMRNNDKIKVADLFRV